MDKKELNFLLNMSEILTGQTSATREEIDEISKYISSNFKALYLEIDESYKEIDHKPIENKCKKQKKHGRGYKKKHHKHSKKKRYKSKKWNRY